MTRLIDRAARRPADTLLLEVHLPRKGRIDPGSAGLLLGLLAGSVVFWTSVGWFAALLVR